MFRSLYKFVMNNYGLISEIIVECWCALDRLVSVDVDLGCDG